MIKVREDSKELNGLQWSRSSESSDPLRAVYVAFGPRRDVVYLKASVDGPTYRFGLEEFERFKQDAVSGRLRINLRD